MTAEGKLDHGGRWRDEWGWPLDRALSVTYFLRGQGMLSEEPPAPDEPPETYAYDPGAPVPTIGAAVTGFYELVKLPEGMNEAYIMPRARMRPIVIEGGAHQKEEPWVLGAREPYLPLVMRPDVLVFQTDLLTDDVEVTGPMTVTLHVSSSAPDTDFTAKLVDVYPPNDDYPGGYHLNLCDSVIRARYRASWTQPRFMEPGQIYAVKIRLPPISNLFKAGHRIRLDVSSSNFPRFDVNPNTGEPMGRHTRLDRAHNTVHLDAEHPSTIVLPTVPVQR
jgi:predicted acyl esterase